MIARPLVEHFLPKYLPGLKRTITRIHYEYLARLDREGQILFMNYGYHDEGYASLPLQLPPRYAPHRYQAQLYHHVASAVDWSGLDVLEVGSGRGGGASFLAQTLKPKSLTGMDLAQKSVDFCRRAYSLAGLRFEQGNAEQLPFGDNTFDIVLNVESALDYPRVERFFAEVGRVLKPGGHFLYADIRYWEEMQTWRRQLHDLQLDLIREHDITPNVVRALDLDYERKSDLVSRRVPKLLRGHFGDFAGLTGAGLYRQQPQDGQRIYLAFDFQKAM